MAERQSISKKIRFEVFKRDSFTCQYCGKKSPDVILEIDHIKPISSGGDNSIINLITSCFDCNRGKSARELSDDSVIVKQRNQMEQLQKKREQIDMMVEWNESLIDLEMYQIDRISKIINQWIYPLEVNESFKSKIRYILKKYTFEETLETINIAYDQYLKYSNDGSVDRNSVENMLEKIPGILNTKKLEKKYPELKDIYYIEGILKNRFHIAISWKETNLLKDALRCGANIDKLKEHAAKVRNISVWRNEIASFVNGGN